MGTHLLYIIEMNVRIRNFKIIKHAVRLSILVGKFNNSTVALRLFTSCLSPQ